ncbi:MAG: hypothetical protein ISP45_03305 [Reyranella sp.]|nr:hypothetical protein [Reyranella sp.]
MFQKLGVLALASTMLVSSSVAAFASNETPALAAGKPAGVKEAALHAPLWVWIAGIGFVALGIGLAASGNGSGHSAGSTTSTNP